MEVLDVGPEDEVLDVCAGTAAVSRLIARRYGCRVTGLDLSEDMLAQGRRLVATAGLADRVQLVQGDASRLPFEDGRFSAVSVTYLLRYVEDVPGTLRELVRVLRPGGVLASMDFGVPPSPIWRALWRAYTGVGLPLAGLLAGGRAWRDAGRFLHRSIPDLYARYPLPLLAGEYAAAGAGDVTVRRMSLGGGVLIRGRRPAVG